VAQLGEVPDENMICWNVGLALGKKVLLGRTFASVMRPGHAGSSALVHADPDRCARTAERRLAAQVWRAVDVLTSVRRREVDIDESVPLVDGDSGYGVDNATSAASCARGDQPHGTAFRPRGPRLPDGCRDSDTNREPVYPSTQGEAGRETEAGRLTPVHTRPNTTPAR
jgi:hypothetical protein